MAPAALSATVAGTLAAAPAARRVKVAVVSVAAVPAALTVTVAGTFAAAPAARRVKVAVVIVAAFMGLLNVAVTVVVSGTPVAPFGGAWAVTVGATSVVKLHTEAVPSGVAMVSVTVPA